MDTNTQSNERRTGLDQTLANNVVEPHLQANVTNGANDLAGFKGF